MISEVADLRVLHCVVKHLSYAKAARELELTASGVSRVISRLESRLGVCLLHRTTRKLCLTEAGAAYHAATVQVLLDLAEAEAELQNTALSPRGKLRVTAPVVFGEMHLVPLMSELMKLYPEMGVELSLVDRFVDLIEEGVDLAIRVGKLADSRLIARRLCTNRRVLVASPDYVKRRGEPLTPQDLSQHDCALFMNFSRPSEWRLVRGEEQQSVSVSGPFSSNNAHAISTAALAGHGITVGATLAVVDPLLSGQLVRVLPEWTFEATSVFAVYPSARQVSRKVRATVDFLANQLSDPPQWDRKLAGQVPGF